MALQHLRSNTASKRPTAGSMSDGQLAINTNATSPGLFFKDAGGALIKIGPVHVGTSAPNSVPAGSSGNAIGEQWLDTSGGGYVFKVWDGTAWRSETGQFVDVAGDTMTGNLTISGADLIMSNGEIVAESGSASTPSITFTGDLNTGFYKPAADKLAISTGGTSRVIIDDSGNVGIGTTDPSETLTISGTTQDVARIKTSAVNAKLYFEASATTSNNYIQCTGDELLAVVNGGERLRIDSNGNVGIGTSSPGVKLHIEGASTTDGTGLYINNTTGSNTQLISTGSSYNFNTVTSGTTWLTTTGTKVAIGPYTAGILQFINNGEKARIDSSGNVGIGLTSPQTPLHVNGLVRINTLAGTGNRAVYSGPSGILTNSSSDATLKTNVTTLGNQSEVVKQLRPVTYNWIDTEERGEQQEVGFIAQEVQPLVPQVIGVNHDETLSVDYSKLTAVLTKALQEAMERIETLEQRLTDAGL